jgi:hypothetical protein
VEIFVDGNAPAEWTVNAVPNSGATLYTFEYGTKKVVFDGAFDGTKAISVDSRTGTVRTGAVGNGLTNATTIEPVGPGTVELKSSSGTATFRWRERWL